MSKTLSEETLKKDAEHKYGFTCDDEVSPYDVEVVEQ